MSHTITLPPARWPIRSPRRFALASFGLPLTLLLTLLGAMAGAAADEGQWQPHQLPQLQKELQRIGVRIPAAQLADLSRHPMRAIVSLGGCSAAFVSDAGLVLTNHHCAYGAIQRNATPQRNYIRDGFLAANRGQELAGGPNTLVYLTDRVENVSARVLDGLDTALSGRARHDAIEQRIKTLIAECETDKAYRCAVPAFHRGLAYYRVRQIMLRDVRLVYAPPDSVGTYGGDVDNYEWPRHTGDYAFLRAYVGKDGRPADPSPDNVPYHSKDFLRVAVDGVRAGDPVLLAGYPGRTSRYKLPVEVRHARERALPLRVAELQADLAVIDAASAGHDQAAVRYADVVKSLNNVLKKSQGLLDGFARKDIATIKDEQDAQFRAWFATQPGMPAGLLPELDAAIAADMALADEEFAWSVASTSDLLKSARSIVRLAHERAKPDAERAPGYQERDLRFIQARLARLEQSFDGAVDQARFAAALRRYAALAPRAHPAGLDALLPAPGALPALYAQSQLGDTARRLAWLDSDINAIAASGDAFLQLAVRQHALGLALEQRRQEVDGNLERVIPAYMQAVIAWKNSQGKPVYADANATLRVTFGTVAPYSVRDGVTKEAFTTVEGVLQKHTGVAPFDAPPALREAVQAKRYGLFRDPVLGTVPVNFLSSADTTGGNSGSAVLNRNGELVGLNFDSTYESITKDWYFDPAITRAIHLDIRYMLWLMREVDHADWLLAEMTLVPAPVSTQRPRGGKGR